MERDFLGLNSKEEITDESKDSAPTRASVMQWSFSNKVSAPPQFLSFEVTQDDGTRKTGFDSLTSTRFMTISSAEAFDSMPKPYSSIMQKNLTPDKQTGTHYKITTYSPQQYDAHSVPQPHQSRIMPIANKTNQMISVTMGAPAYQSFHASAGQNVIGSAIKPQSLGVPVISPVSIAPSSTSIVGTTELRNASKSSGGPAQLTIFYAGSVCVYDEVSPEKAQAIMLLAGNEHSATPNKTVSRNQAEAPMPRPSGVDGFVGNQSLNTSPCSGLPSPISVTSHPAPLSAGISTSTTNIKAMRSIGIITPQSTKPETSKAVSSLGPVSVTVIPSAVPQARKASLARFLEKRKERATSTSPYLSKQSPD